MCCCRGGPGKSEWRLSPQTVAFPLQTGEGGLGEDAEKTLNVPGRKMKAEGTREKTLEGEGGERKGGVIGGNLLFTPSETPHIWVCGPREAAG